ncbi:Putative ribonuclease P subunit, Rpr2/Snm1/Rpp21 [Septoria linicola]|uniref:Ribonuclease P subunit, Rpr2/Snm1/Rpp21 n=1 Tax=Septoria linicola TaxID=215465 RepID=A0A9Q9AMH4_9PEZI|nr:putative ribonuclease P subunit, Rpr2/Snm1/Rpp21 [Septoria linicola]USW48732.1 Putative ribonuclease P subunit, Rpr2/Snm1/Rpp21 [Septoria linicola]
MAKEKPRGPKAPPNKHLLARTAFLHQAAIYVASLQDTQKHSATVSHTTNQTQSGLPDDKSTSSDIIGTPDLRPQAGGLPHIFAAQLRQVALKSQIRLSLDVKRAICKACSAVHVDRRTCAQSVENLSRDGKKKCANVLVIECLACGNRKRIPTGANRQRRKGKRAGIQAQENETSTDHASIKQDTELEERCLIHR